MDLLKSERIENSPQKMPMIDDARNKKNHNDSIFSNGSDFIFYSAEGGLYHTCIGIFSNLWYSKTTRIIKKKTTHPQNCRFASKEKFPWLAS